MSNSGIIAGAFIRNDRVYGAEIWLRNDAFLDQALQIGLTSEDGPLWSAVNDKDVRAVQSALDRGFSSSTTVIVPCEGAKKYFVENRIQDLPNEKEIDSYIVSYDGPVSILMYAAARSAPEIVSMLVSAGANVDFVGVGRQTAFQFMLDLRRAFGSSEKDEVVRIAKCFMQANANVNRVDDLGNTALLSAADNRQSDVVKMLVENGADVNWNGRNGISPFFHAVLNQDDKLAEYLIDQGADIEAKNSRGRTALMMAAASGYTRCLELLLERGSNACAVDNDGNTALDLMQQCDWNNWDLSYCRNWESEREIQEMLYKHGARYKAYSYLNDSLERKFNPAPQSKPSDNNATSWPSNASSTTQYSKANSSTSSSSSQSSSTKSSETPFSWGTACVFALCGAFTLPILILLVTCMINPHGHIGDLTSALIPGAIGGVITYGFIKNW